MHPLTTVRCWPLTRTQWEMQELITASVAATGKD